MAALLREHLLSQDLFHHSQIVRLAVHDVLQVLDVLSQLLNFGGVELLCIIGGLLDVEPGTDIDKDMRG